MLLEVAVFLSDVHLGLSDVHLELEDDDHDVLMLSFPLSASRS